ncbi:unnamed protein product [Amoebophrya sp. A120]|nr:unnamed protein product [Amoebophrya sp. A120]|eukprot:GSA120T00012603001.1
MMFCLRSLHYIVFRFQYILSTGSYSNRNFFCFVSNSNIAFRSRFVSKNSSFNTTFVSNSSSDTTFHFVFNSNACTHFFSFSRRRFFRTTNVKIKYPMSQKKFAIPTKTINASFPKMNFSKFSCTTRTQILLFFMIPIQQYVQPVQYLLQFSLFHHDSHHQHHPP